MFCFVIFSPLFNVCIWNILIQLHFRQRFMLSEPFNAIEAHHLHKTDCIFKWISTQHNAWFHSFESHFYDDETTLHTNTKCNQPSPSRRKKTHKQIYKKKTLKHILSFSCWKINCAPEEEKNTHTKWDSHVIYAKGKRVFAFQVCAQVKMRYTRDPVLDVVRAIKGWD